MLPGVDEDGRQRMARVPIALCMWRSKPSVGFAAVFAALSATVRYFLIFFAVLSVYLASRTWGRRWSPRGTRSRRSISPGRSTFCRVDRWTGEMVRCSTTVGPAEPVC